VREDGHAGIVILDDLTLGGLAYQFLEGGIDQDGALIHDLPLGGGRQWNPEALLQPLQTIERDPTAILEQGDHTGCRGVVLLRSDAGRRLGGKHFQAEIAAQFLQRVDGSRQGSLAGDAYQCSGGSELIELATAALWAERAGTQMRMGNGDGDCAGVILGAIAAMPLAGR
jgi:hypothetical protein